jgi:hypothetical protein
MVAASELVKLVSGARVTSPVLITEVRLAKLPVGPPTPTQVDDASDDETRMGEIPSSLEVLLAYVGGTFFYFVSVDPDGQGFHSGTVLLCCT